jgi:hypothetical protein
MEDHVYVFHGGACNVLIAHVGLDEIDLVCDGVKIAPFASEQVVNNADRTVLRDEYFADI